MSRQIPKDVRDRVRLHVQTVDKVYEGKNEKYLRRKIPMRVLNTLSRAMLVPMVKFLSSRGSTAGLHSSVIKKMTKKEMAKYIAVQSTYMAIGQAMIVFVVTVFVSIAAEYDPKLNRRMHVISGPTGYAKALAMNLFVLNVVAVILKRRFGNFESQSTVTRLDKANTRVKEMVKGRPAYVHKKTKTEKISIATMKIGVLLGGAFGVAAALKGVVCQDLSNRGLSCTCANIERMRDDLIILLGNDIPAHIVQAYGGRKAIKRSIRIHELCMKLMRCGRGGKGLFGDKTSKAAACELLQTLDGNMKTAQCMDMTCADLKRVYRKLALVYHPDKGGDATKFEKLNRANMVLKEHCRKRGNVAAAKSTATKKASAKKTNIEDID